MEEANTLNDEERLKLTVYSAVSTLCDSVGDNNTFVDNFCVSPDAKAAIAELIWKKTSIYAEDLEAFAQHAKRTKVNIEDVKLLFRKNESIIDAITKAESEESEKPPEKSNKRKRNPGPSKE